MAILKSYTKHEMDLYRLWCHCWHHDWAGDDMTERVMAAAGIHPDDSIVPEQFIAACLPLVPRSTFPTEYAPSWNEQLGFVHVTATGRFDWEFHGEDLADYTELKGMVYRLRVHLNRPAGRVLSIYATITHDDGKNQYVCRTNIQRWHAAPFLSRHVDAAFEILTKINTTLSAWTDGNFRHEITGMEAVTPDTKAIHGHWITETPRRGFGIFTLTDGTQIVMPDEGEYLIANELKSVAQAASSNTPQSEIVIRAVARWLNHHVANAM